MTHASPPPRLAGSDLPCAPLPSVSTREWWGARRWRYNRALVLAGLAAFAAYVAALEFRCADTPSVEVTLFTTAFQGVGYLVMMGGANVCYQLGPGLERLVPEAARARYRCWAYAAGLGVSVALPFLVPLAVLFMGCQSGEL